MPKPYQPKPCRACGGPKERDSHGRIRGWYCTKCSNELRKKYGLNLCGSEAPGHDRWTCPECSRIYWERRREAAARGAATRAKNNATWRKPFNAEKFWQSRAHSAVQAAIKRGILPNLKSGDYACADCGKVALEYDHRDYGRPLDVDPVCRSCNHARGTAVWPSVDFYNFKRIGEPAERVA